MTTLLPSAISARSLSKSYGMITALDDFTLEVPRGSIFGLLGPNGAGKTTTISTISCLLAPDGGDVTVGGHSVRSDVTAVKRELGVVPQEIALYPTLSAGENLAFWGRMYGLSGAALKKAVDDALLLAGLEDRSKERVEKYSGGMKRRINIAAGILHTPRVLLMDEPTVGIDPQSRNHILETVKELNGKGMTVLYTSHYMEEVEFLCDRIAIMDHGKIIAMGTLNELRAVVGGMDVVDVKVESVSDLVLEQVRAIPGVKQATRTEDALQVLTPGSGSVLGKLVGTLESEGSHVTSIAVTEPNLESVFLHLTGKSLRD